MKLTINLTLYLLFFSIFFLCGFFGEGNNNTGLGLIPRQLTWMPEILASLIALYLCAIFAINKKISSPAYYPLFFLFFFLHIVAGIAVNAVAYGAIFAGIRKYFAYIPLFFLPLFYEFSENEIKNQLKFLLIVALFQCPLAIYQRFYLFRNSLTGDYITGTLSISSILSIFQICCIAILTGFYLKKRIKLFLFLLLSIILFFPTTLNETKGTIILFPIAIITTVFLSAGSILAIRKYLTICAIGMMIVLVFMPLYNHFRAYRGETIVDFFLKEGRVSNYLFIGDPKEEKVGRIDALLFPFKKLSNEPFKLIIGLGIGNVNASFIKGFSGEYTELDEFGANKITAASLIWETGLIGLLLYYVFFWFVFTDSLALRRINSAVGDIALGWTAIIVILSISFFYKNIFHQKAIGYLFWYFSGLIASKRAAMQASTPRLAIN